MALVEDDDDDALFAELYGIDDGGKSRISERPEVSVEPASQKPAPYLPENSLNWEGSQTETSDAHRAEYEADYQGHQDEDLGIKIVLESGNNTTSDGNSGPGQLYRQPPHFVDPNKTTDANGYQPRPNRYVRPEIQSQNSNGSQVEIPQRPPAETGVSSFSTSTSGPIGQATADTSDKSQLQGIGPTGRSRPRRFAPQIQVKNVFELDIDALEDKPWRRPGEDVSDYFNYDLTEGTWKEYVRKYNEAKKDAALKEQHQEQIHVLDGDDMPSGARPAPSPIPAPQGHGRGRAMSGGPPTYMPPARPYMPPNFMMGRGYERPPLPMVPRPPVPWVGAPAIQRAPPLPPGRPPIRPPISFTSTMYMGADRVHSSENGGRGRKSSDFEPSKREDEKGFSGSDYLAKHEASRRERDSQSSYASRRGDDKSTKSKYERNSRETEREYSQRDRPRDRDRRRDRSRERDRERHSYDRRRSYSPSRRDRSGHRS